MDGKINFLNSEQTGFALGKVTAFKSSMLTVSDPAGRTIIEVDHYGIVHVGQDFIDKQPEETAKAILKALDRSLLQSNKVVIPCFPIYSDIKYGFSVFEHSEYVISCCYGTINPFVLGLWGKLGDTWYRVGEYYWASKEEGWQKTDYEYLVDLIRFAGGKQIKYVVVDPSAASFIDCIRRSGKFEVIPAIDSGVEAGIYDVQQAFKRSKIAISPVCTGIRQEFETYYWETLASTKRTHKRMDELRFFVSTMIGDRKVGKNHDTQRT